MAKTLLKTPLGDVHRQAGAKMVEFAGWDMPVQYRGLREEHETVRSHAGLFDLSHMGEIEVRGRQAFEYIQYLITNDLERAEVHQCLYTTMVNFEGRVLDDMLVYRFPERFWLVVNASNKDKIWSWMNERKEGFEVELEDLSMETALIAVQGPKAQEALAPHVDLDLDQLGYYRLTECRVGEGQVVLSRTGYTGEDGFEIYLPWGQAEASWKALMDRFEGLEPIGLGARDTLRLEAGYCLYGNELTEEITPYDAGLGWVVRLDCEFVGDSVLKAQKEAGLTKAMIGFEMEGKTIPRTGYPVLHEGVQVGQVTSGTFSPSLKKGVGLAIVEKSARAPGTTLEVEIRGRKNAAVVKRPPFVQGSVKRG